MYVWYGWEEFSTESLPLFMVLYITQVLPIILPLKWFDSEIAFLTKYFVVRYSTDVVTTNLIWPLIDAKWLSIYKGLFIKKM